ncbi:MAG: ECF transporter S component, partial [Oscillospiraceae bacterium]|nr:ECF transporter S component [Oscillospiraceae bacterium]
STCFGTDPFGTALVNQGFGTALLVAAMCLIPRVLAGWLPGLVYKWINLKFGDAAKLKIVWTAVASLIGSLLNTVLFVGALVLLFAKNPVTTEAFQTADVWIIITMLVTSNAIFEAIACVIVGGGVSRALLRFLPVNRESAPNRSQV